MKIIHVAAAVIVSDDQIFATQRGYGDWKDYWEFPGGKIESGETPEEALRREIFEELDTEIAVGEKLATVEYDYPDFHLCMECFLAAVMEGSLVLKEHEAAKWLKKKELDSVNWLPADRILIDQLKQWDLVSKKKNGIRRARSADSRVLAELAIQMWDENEIEDLESEFAELIQDENAACFIQTVDDRSVGFAQCGLRSDYVEGTDSSPVGYLEGIFVLAPFRNQGYAKELLACCEQWARKKGCTEFASDCELENNDSLAFHLAMGFEEANRIICFKKNL